MSPMLLISVILYLSSIIMVGSVSIEYLFLSSSIEGELESPAIEINNISFPLFSFKSINMLDITCCSDFLIKLGFSYS